MRNGALLRESARFVITLPMELQTVTRQRRSRNRAQKTTGVVDKTTGDALGIAEPLERYGELMANQLTALYNAIQGLPPRSQYALRRLKQLYHEAQGLKPWSKILIRPTYQWRHGYHHQAIYRR